MITFESKGSFQKTDTYLKRLLRQGIYRQLSRYGAKGVDALSAATPKGPTGQAANSWYYEVTHTGTTWELAWCNRDNEGGVNVAILLQYGHGTGTGGYVKGRDYINPAIKPIFDEIAAAVWKEVTAE